MKLREAFVDVADVSPGPITGSQRQIAARETKKICRDERYRLRNGSEVNIRDLLLKTQIELVWPSTPFRSPAPRGAFAGRISVRDETTLQALGDLV
jgi:hypothetical protein